MYICGIRGATTVEENTKESILEGTRTVLKEMLKRNQLELEDIISVFFTCTKDLNAVYPAVAARELGINQAALFCCQEMDVPSSLPMCIRVLAHVSAPISQKDVYHVYLEKAKTLRKDLCAEDKEEN